MTEATIEHEEGATRGRYHAAVAGSAEDAEMTYSRAGAATLVIDHTSVPDAARGTGLGARLVARAVEDARAAGRKIVPLCPFARAQFGRHPEWRDVLAP